MNTRTPKSIAVFNRTLVAAMLAASGAAQAGHDDDDDRGYRDYHNASDYRDYRDQDRFMARAKVISSRPIYESVNEPRRECWTETVGYESRGYRSSSNTMPTIVGAVAGGLLGSAVGKGNGKVAAAAVGAATGAVVGNRWNENDGYHDSRPRQVERCRTVDNYRQVVRAYDVRYRYQGREYTTQLPYNPGKWVALDVNFNVVDDHRSGYRQTRY